MTTLYLVRHGETVDNAPYHTQQDKNTLLAWRVPK